MKTTLLLSLKKRCSLLVIFIISFSAFSQIPSGYYNLAEGHTGETLKLALHGIIDSHIEYPYSSSNTDVWDILKDADKDPNNANNVIGLYSGFSMDASAEYASGSGWNREHVWAKSRGNLGTTMGPGTDLHHIRAADVSTNSARNNRNFDVAPDQYTDSSGNYNGITDSYTSTVDWIWEPRDEVKGDVARMILYMTVRYEGDNGEPDLELTDTYLSNSSNDPLQGKASVLMAWHLADPVSAEEQLRNDIIYSYQNNRNPFIDHPEYACLIYPEYCDGSIDDGNEIFISEYIEGSSYNKAIEIANTTGVSIDLSNYSLKKQTNGSGAWGSNYALSGTLDDGNVFVLAHGSADASITGNANQTTTSGIMTFNGNDPIGLFKNGVLIDIIGDFNNGSSNFAKDVTKVRIETVTEPNDSYTTTEWVSYSKNTFDYLGAHPGAPALSQELFISEYIEGSSYNKSIEIRNLTGNTISLSAYSLKKQTNGSGNWASEYVLNGNLNNDDVFVIAHSSANASIINQADITTSSGIMTFNGNDPIGLFKNGVLIDIVGDFNNGASYFAKDVTKVRTSETVNPNTTYTISEWDDYSSNTFDTIGQRVSNSPFDDTFTFYPNPVKDKLYWKNDDILNVSIYNQSGQMVKTVSKTFSKEIDLSPLESGMYIIVAQSKDMVFTEKFIKQ